MTKKKLSAKRATKRSAAKSTPKPVAAKRAIKRARKDAPKPAALASPAKLARAEARAKLVVAATPPDDGPESVTTGTFLATLRRADPPRWSAAVRHALRVAGNVSAAATALRVQRKTLQRWLSKTPALREGVALVGHGQHPAAPAAKAAS